MKITVLYLHVVKSGYASAPPAEYYLPFSQRWARTYREYNAGCAHELIILCCGAPADEHVKATYGGLFCTYDTYLGAGSDIGACQSALKKLSGFVVCMSTPVYFWRPGWLRRLVEAREFFGDGLYGPMASYQNAPHIRTSCWGVDAATFQKYPHLIDCREKCCWAESYDHQGELWQISKWYASINKPALMVSWSEVSDKAHWRTPENIFRRGNQTNCLVWDQHVDVYNAAHYHERLDFAKQADTITASENHPLISENSEKV